MLEFIVCCIVVCTWLLPLCNLLLGLYRLKHLELAIPLPLVCVMFGTSLLDAVINLIDVMQRLL